MVNVLRASLAPFIATARGAGGGRLKKATICDELVYGATFLSEKRAVSLRRVLGCATSPGRLCVLMSAPCARHAAVKTQG